VTTQTLKRGAAPPRQKAKAPPRNEEAGEDSPAGEFETADA
jgi:hypothetical protein